MENMTEKVRILFEGAREDGPPFVTIENPALLTAGVTRQIARYGVTRRSGGQGTLSGRLQGARKDFLAMVQSYGVGIEIVRKR
jgi:hypothetical protein